RQRHGRADDLVLEDQVLGPELPEVRVLHERPVGARERHEEDGELRPQTRAWSAGQWTALIFWSGCIGALMSASPRLSTFASSSGEKALSASITPSVSVAGSTFLL